jgi:hypothetical protein
MAYPYGSHSQHAAQFNTCSATIDHITGKIMHETTQTTRSNFRQFVLLRTAIYWRGKQMSRLLRKYTSERPLGKPAMNYRMRI